MKGRDDGTEIRGAKEAKKKNTFARRYAREMNGDRRKKGARRQTHSVIAFMRYVRRRRHHGGEHAVQGARAKFWYSIRGAEDTEPK